jgi:hypothetical protein
VTLPRLTGEAPVNHRRLSRERPHIWRQYDAHPPVGEPGWTWMAAYGAHRASAPTPVAAYKIVTFMHKMHEQAMDRAFGRRRGLRTYSDPSLWQT